MKYVDRDVLNYVFDLFLLIIKNDLILPLRIYYYIIVIILIFVILFTLKDIILNYKYK